MPGPIISREVERFRRDPVSVRNAMALILIATILTMFIAGFLVWLFDRQDFPNIGVALWWALQTVTTVGYGDVTPKTVVGRLIGSFVLIESIAFLTIVTAVITSTFVEQARRQRERAEGGRYSELVAALSDLSAKLDQLEASVRDLRGGPQSRSEPDG
jgi:voltage-gated potassium channel Kch